MNIGGAFLSAWHSATEDARKSAAAIATGAEKVASAIGQGAEDFKEAAVAGVDAAADRAGQVEASAERKAAEIVSGVQHGLATAKNKAIDAVDWAADKTGEAEAWVKAKGSQAVQLAKKAAQSVKAGFVKLKDAFGAVVKKGLAVAECVGVSLMNFGLNVTGSILAFGLTSPSGGPLHKLTLGGLEAATDRGGDMKAYDGRVVGAGCSDNPPFSHPSGVTPSATSGCSEVKGKITYVNGINTEFHPNSSSSDPKSGICYTMQKIADQTCSEVTGVYNATEGIGKDLAECEQNIMRGSNSPAVKSLADEIANNVRNGTELTVFAHSQGGLITQEALVEVRNQLKIGPPGWSDAKIDDAMRVVTVKSFGTATDSWPKGPNYEQFTNLADPVPQVIAAAQLNLDPPGEPHAEIPAKQQHFFWSAHVDPFDSHSMDDVYLPYYSQVNATTPK